MRLSSRSNVASNSFAILDPILTESFPMTSQSRKLMVERRKADNGTKDNEATDHGRSATADKLRTEGGSEIRAEKTTPNAQRPTSNIQHPTSNIQHPTSNAQ